MAERIYQVGEEVEVRRWKGLRRARIVRAGRAVPSGGEWGPDTASFVLYVESRDAWSRHPQPLFESEMEDR